MKQEILEYNKKFVEEKRYEVFRTSKFPDKKVAIVTCMDTRLTELLPAALGLKNGDAKIIKNAGGVISHPFGSAVRSLLIAIYELEVEEIFVIGHTDCGVQQMNSEKVINNMRLRGIPNERISLARDFGIDLNTWLKGFQNVKDAVQNSISMLRRHPLVPDDIKICGFIMDSDTGELVEI